MLHPRYVGNFRSLSYKRVISWYSGLVKKQPPEAPYTHIVQIGDPTLRTVSEEIPRHLIKSPEIEFLIKLMRKVMKEYNCVGLSSSQIGTPFQLFLMEFNEKHMKSYSPQERKIKEIELVPFQVVINPKIRVTDFTKVTFPESCESVKGFRAEVARFRSVQLTALNGAGEEFTLEASGWPARIIQHEADHLNGRIYTDVMNRETLACSCWQVINERRGKVELPYGSA